MRGFLSLEPDETTLAGLVLSQNRLRDALSRQGVSFPERLGATLLAWPYATFDQLSEAFERLTDVPPLFRPEPLHGMPHDDRPAEIGFPLSALAPLQQRLFDLLRETLDPNPPKPAFLRLARVSPPSRKVGAVLRGSGAIGRELGAFTPVALAIWHQTSHGYGLYRTMRGHRGES